MHYSRSKVVRAYDPTVERVIWFIVAGIGSLIAIRFFMKLLGASYQADFVRFLYGVRGPLVVQGIFQTSGSGNQVLEPESLIAIAIYLLIGWGRRRPDPDHQHAEDYAPGRLAFG